MGRNRLMICKFYINSYFAILSVQTYVMRFTNLLTIFQFAHFGCEQSERIAYPKRGTRRHDTLVDTCLPRQKCLHVCNLKNQKSKIPYETNCNKSRKAKAYSCEFESFT